MNRVFRLLTRILVIIGLLLLLVVLLIGIISAAFNWQGVCEVTEGAPVPCTWLRFALGEMFWALFVFIPYFFLAALILLGMSLYQFIRSLVQRLRKAKQGG
jgi:hypothetical protein